MPKPPRVITRERSNRGNLFNPNTMPRQNALRASAAVACMPRLVRRFRLTAFAADEGLNQRAPEANDKCGRTHKNGGKERRHTKDFEERWQRPDARPILLFVTRPREVPGRGRQTSGRRSRWLRRLGVFGLRTIRSAFPAHVELTLHVLLATWTFPVGRLTLIRP